MKINRIFIVFIAIFLVLTVGCANKIKNEEIKNEGNKIVVEKRVGEADTYEHYNEIKDSKEVQKLKDILDSISWETVKVSMAYPPHYKFHFEDTNNKASGAVYELWISPYKETVELLFVSSSKYVHLNAKVSAELFKIITGKELDSD